MQTLYEISNALDAGQTTSRELTERSFSRIDDPAGEGARAFIRLFRDEAFAAADASDARRAQGLSLSPIDGIPVSVKDLCDIEGVTTLAGSHALDEHPPADSDAPAVARLRQAGAVILGTNNMVEFALGGLGLNGHYGTPKGPWDRETGRAPGGSSSGGGVAVADGMAAVALGTDTAGSIRMPSAACGLVGFKPTARRVPLDGMVPLSTSLDSAGPLAHSVACCATVDAILSNEIDRQIPEIDASGLRIGVPQTFVLDDMDETVAAAFDATLKRLEAAGVRIVPFEFPALARLPEINHFGGLPIAEGYAWHRELLETREAFYEPVISGRFKVGAKVSAADYIDVLNARAEMISIADEETAPFDAIAMPTLPIVPPPIAELENDRDAYLRGNLLFIRNNAVANFLDRCAITIPCTPADEAPVGFMLFGETMGDTRLLSIASAIEIVVRPV